MISRFPDPEKRTGVGDTGNMANIKSAKKRIKTSAGRQARNRSVKSEVSTTRTKLYAAIEAGDSSKSGELFRLYGSLLDKAVKKGMVKANAASRRKSRAAARLKQVVQPAA